MAYQGVTNLPRLEFDGTLKYTCIGNLGVVFLVSKCDEIMRYQSIGDKMCYRI